MRAGALRHRGRIERPIRAGRTQAGEALQAWETFAEVWADLRSVSGLETQVAMQLAATSSHVAQIRWTPAVDPTMRLILRDDGAGRERVLQIDAVLDPKNRRDMMELYCTEQPPLAGAESGGLMEPRARLATLPPGGGPLNG